MKNFLLLIITLAGTALYSQSERGFNFIESSAGMNYPTWESGRTELEFADINRDGFVDILSIGDHGCPNVGAQEHGIMVWFGNGAGTWSVQMTGNFGYGGIAVGDVNNDGHWDVGYGMHHNYSSTDLGNQKLEVALGDGSGINWTAWDDGLATNGESWGLFGTDFADVDNDGDLDIGANSFGAGDGLHVYLNQGEGTWQQSFGFLSSGNSFLRFVFGDINNDGNADFVLSNEAGIAFFGDGTGNFTDADYNLPQGIAVLGPDLGDVNKDGAKDLAYVNLDGGINVWSFHVSSNQWINLSGSLPATGNYQECQLCDFNNDDMLDLAAFGNAHLTVWSGDLINNQTILWTQEFNMTTSNNGYCSAFRAGGDVDRNGFPDMAWVEKVGSYPNDQNHLKCFKETTPYFQPNINLIFPKGDEVFKQNSIQFIDWISAVPVSSEALVKIDYSLQGTSGPWMSVTPGTENSGRYQWTIPQTISSNNCFLKFTLVEGSNTLIVITPQAFTILGDSGLEADFVADSTIVYPNSQIQFSDQSLGLITSWAWDFDNNGTVDDTVRNPVYAYPASGKYTVKLTISDGTNSEMEVKTDYITVTSPVGIDNEKINPGNLIVFPNPCSDLLHVRYQIYEPGQIIFELTDMLGKQVRRLSHEVHAAGIYEETINIDQLPGGVYFYRIEAGDYLLNDKILITN